MDTIKMKKMIPAIRINNRGANQRFLEDNLGFKTYLEDSAFAEFGDRESSEIKLVLIESPSMRTRAVKGVKKLHQIVIRVKNPAEVEALLAGGATFTKLYKGLKGYAFESISPENDCFLLHAEEDLADLVEILPPVAFRSLDGFEKLTAFSVEKVIINTPQPAESRAFYDALLPGQEILDFREAAGEDLLVAAETTWDLDSLRIPVPADMDWSELEAKLTAPFFKDKKERFLQTADRSNIELWFEK
ncbi:CppA N-terminal domain-containing protein [Streptococcus acidominimus]|uniref:Chemotaxis protein n=2 Tax=Streptococcus acidominimus TaxID=1326 RepID=A0A1Q8EFZ5_STRAI|nr:CppA N-terminal domain-containing protein [Streptococcus acidominimus]MBF0846817.1 chemotaxis protein [Streptococcus danieliae]MBF0819146.1 chemotaxis protein [Streptococcus acidominimus]MBF0838689.1 chemotaxis protein [Streptococcus acidominimus]OLF50676.1 chemotaxis protein [Streptococcus acidominimus]TFU30302.1 chemotaxis protein [Streptococcus acidominimus]